MSQQNPESTVETKSILDVINEDIGPIPTYILSLFEFLGYNTYETLKDFSIQDVDDIERFARDELSRLISDTVEEKKKYYGSYHGFSKMFRILPGHKKLILSIPTYIREANDNNTDREHFVRRLQRNSQKNFLRASFKRSSDSLSSAVEETEESDQGIHNAYIIDEEDDHISEDQIESPSENMNFSTFEMVSDVKRIRLGENSIKTQNDEHRIRDTINRWLMNVKQKLKSDSKIILPLVYSIVFYHRPEEGKMSATIECCMCQIQIGISSHRNKNGSRRWLISNFMRHVKKCHFQVQHQQGQQQQLINIVDIATLVKREVE